MGGKVGPRPLAIEVNAAAARQHGVVSRGRLLELGLGAGAIEHRLASGRLTQLHRGVYAVGVPSGAREQRWMAAALACGEGAVLSHLSAAALWRLMSVDPPLVDVSVPSRSGRSRPGLRIHRPRRLDPEDTGRLRGIPVTAVDRTLIDVAAAVSRRTLERTLDEAEYLGLLDRRSLAAALERHAGRAGAARLGACLRRHEPGTTRTRSKLEEAFLDLVRRAGLPQPAVNAQLGRYEVDFLWRKQRLVVETDGGASHTRGAARERDSRRDAWLEARGFHTMRFTWSQVRHREGEVLAALAARL